MIDKTPQVFISYSWTSKEYQETVISLASRLRHDGVDVKLDVWDLKDGQDKYAFMEQCVSDPNIDKVLILSDKLYSEKADNRDGGVGDETTIISSEVYGNTEQEKFIPVVMERSEEGEVFLPKYLKSRLYRDLTGDNYEAEYQELLRTIFNAPSHRKPELGMPPAWLTEETPDELYPVKDAVRKLSASNLGKMKNVVARDFVDAYIEAMKQFYRKNPTIESYLEDFIAMKEYRDVFLDHLKTFSSTEHFGFTMADEFERLYNSLFNIKTFEPKSFSCGYDAFDIFRTHVWELFVCTVAFMLHYELYQDINELLVHTYFLRNSPLGTEKMAISYEGIRFHSKMMEEVIKPSLEGDMSRKYTLLGHYVVNEREYLPIYSAENISKADLFLYQVYKGLELDEVTWRYAWFPQLYVYAEEYETIWKRLVSKQYCKKIMPIFGVNNIEEFKERIAKCTPDRDYHYSGSFHSAGAILSYVKLEDVASLP